MNNTLIMMSLATEQDTAVDAWDVGRAAWKSGNRLEVTPSDERDLRDTESTRTFLKLR